MLKLFVSSAAAALALAASAAPAQAALGPDAPSCRAGAGDPAVLVNVTGFKSRTGRVRVQIYNGSNFLVKGQRVRRVDLPVTGATMPICVALPGPGTYAVAVRHDVNGNGKSGDWSDGGGFSRNPKISLLDLKPSFSEVAIPVGRSPKAVSVVLNYRRGVSIGPVNKS
ncbi:MAG TPA: DUF2141 domain-containing protein [Sphingomicrobium sp.]|jgi:uncharacterized protein (DUF2141 family)|nr:DUF2141 domain-containing protein [Sphingomicrobium sp.]